MIPSTIKKICSFFKKNGNVQEKIFRPFSVKQFEQDI